MYFPFTTPHIQKAFYLMFPYSTCIDNDTHSVRTAGLHTVKRTERYQSTSRDIVYVKLSDERWLVNKTILPTNRVKVVLAFKGYTCTHVHVHFLSQSCLLVCVTPLLFSSDLLCSVNTSHFWLCYWNSYIVYTCTCTCNRHSQLSRLGMWTVS